MLRISVPCLSQSHSSLLSLPSKSIRTDAVSQRRRRHEEKIAILDVPGHPGGSQPGPLCLRGVGAQQADTIKIGAALCLTGIQAPLDEPALKGAQLAVDEINKKGGVLGKQLELINLDCKSDPVTTGNVAVQLIDQGAKAIIAPSDFDFGGPASREAQKAGLVGISPAASSPLYGSDALGDKQFTMSMWNTTMGAAAAQYAREQGWKTAYVVTDDFIQYTKDLGEYFIKAWEDGGGTILYQEKYTQGAADFSAQLARMKALPEQPDFYLHLLLHAGPGPDHPHHARGRHHRSPSWAATRTMTPACSRRLARSTAMTSSLPPTPGSRPTPPRRWPSS